MALTETFLELAPEFGGTRFGPFKGMEIRLGSDPGSNDIVLPENLGVLANHVKLISQGDGSFIVAPIERTAGVFVYRAGSSAKQVTSPVAIQGSSDTYSADSFALVTPEGPKFYVLLVMQKQEAKTKDDQFNSARKRLSGGSLFNELKRQGLVMFLTTRGGQYFQRWGTFVKTGAIFRPRYLIGGAAVVAGWLFAGGLGLVACQAAVGQKKIENDYKTCQDNLNAAGGGEDGKPSLEVFMSKVLSPIPGQREEEWVRSLNADVDFAEAVRQALGELYANPERLKNLRWVYRTNGTDFTKVRTEMEKAGWSPALIKIMAYTAAIEGASFRDKEWTFIESDSIGAEVCGRGPMAMTWRQAVNLGIPDVSIDAAMPYPKYGAAGAPEKLEAIQATAGSLRTFDPPDEYGDIEGQQASNDNSMVCLFNGDPSEPTDPRSAANTEALIKALGSSVGPKGRDLPAADTGAFRLEARLLKYWAADYKGEFRKLKFDTASIPSAKLTDAKPVQQYAMSKAAETVAKAIIIPCMAVQDPNLKNYDTDKTVGPLPEPLDCIIVKGMIEFNVR